MQRHSLVQYRLLRLLRTCYEPLMLVVLFVAGAMAVLGRPAAAVVAPAAAQANAPQVRLARLPAATPEPAQCIATPAAPGR